MSNVESVTLNSSCCPTLWDEIKEHVKENELFELESLVGQDVIDELNDLIKQVNVLLDLLPSEKLAKNKPTKNFSDLPEPPDLRRKLKKEIKHFVKAISEHMQINGRDSSEALKNRDEDILKYVFRNDNEACSSKSPNRTSAIQTSRSSIDISEIKNKLNYMNFDEITSHLRALIQAEIDTLTIDVQLLQAALLQSSAEDPLKASCPEPSIAELIKERQKLEEDYLAISRLFATGSNASSTSRSIPAVEKTTPKPGNIFHRKVEASSGCAAASIRPNKAQKFRQWVLQQSTENSLLLEDN